MYVYNSTFFQKEDADDIKILTGAHRAGIYTSSITIIIKTVLG